MAEQRRRQGRVRSVAAAAAAAAAAAHQGKTSVLCPGKHIHTNSWRQTCSSRLLLRGSSRSFSISHHTCKQQQQHAAAGRRQAPAVAAHSCPTRGGTPRSAASAPLPPPRWRRCRPWPWTAAAAAAARAPRAGLACSCWLPAAHPQSSPAAPLRGRRRRCCCHRQHWTTLLPAGPCPAAQRGRWQAARSTLSQSAAARPALLRLLLRMLLLRLLLLQSLPGDAPA